MSGYEVAVKRRAIHETMVAAVRPDVEAWRQRLRPAFDALIEVDAILLGLNRRERQVLPMLIDGHNLEEIARELGLSSKTVHQYSAAVLRKFGVGSKAQLLAKIIGRLSDGAAERQAS